MANQFSVDSFVSKFLEVGLVQPSNFYVRFPTPVDGFDDVAFLCGAAALPGKRITTTDLKPYGYGQTIRMPYDVMYDEVELTFYVDSKRAASLHLFEKWMSLIVGGSGTGADGKLDRTNLNGHSLFPKNKIQVAYKKDYVKDVKIYVLNQMVGTEVVENADSASTSASMALIECTLVDAYPIQISPVQLDWGSGDEFVRINVTFAFRTVEYRFGELNLQAVEGKYYNARSPYDTSAKVNQEAKDISDFLNSTANFIGSIAATAQKINQFKTNLTILKRADGIVNTTSALLPFLGNNRTAIDTINNVNKIISGTNFIKQNLNNVRKFP
jgi:hypothetical protein